jgi:isopenicillin N synthase-like dioxygenase
MHGTAGTKDGKLYLSQGVSRSLGNGDGGKFTEIPVIDLSAMINPEASEKQKNQLVSSIRDACIRVGFSIIKNHGIDWKIVEDSFAALEEFFGLPMEKKMEVHQNKSSSYMGYEQPYYTNVDRLKKGCRGTKPQG